MQVLKQKKILTIKKTTITEKQCQETAASFCKQTIFSTLPLDILFLTKREQRKIRVFKPIQ